jgi:hypothetical protein
MASKYGTNFVESEALLAAASDDEEEMQRILQTMLPTERTSLLAACNFLSIAIVTFEEKN